MATRNLFLLPNGKGVSLSCSIVFDFESADKDEFVSHAGIYIKDHQRNNITNLMHLVASNLSQCDCFLSSRGQTYSPVRPTLPSVRRKARERCSFLMNVRGLKGQEEEVQYWQRCSRWTFFIALKLCNFKKSPIDSVRNKSIELQEVQTAVDNAQVVSKSVNKERAKSVRSIGQPTGSSKANYYRSKKFGRNSTHHESTDHEPTNSSRWRVNQGFLELKLAKMESNLTSYKATLQKENW